MNRNRNSKDSKRSDKKPFDYKGKRNRKVSKSPAGKQSREYREFDRNPEDQYDSSGNNKKGENDFSWYNRFPELISGSASIPFPYKPGMDINPGISVTSPTGVTGIPIYHSIPGVVAINWIPSVGYANDANSPINIVANQLYAAVRKAFSGRIYADGSDMILMMVALDSIFGYIASLKRIYRIINKYNPANYNIPDTILQAIGINSTSASLLREQKTRLWTHINELIHLSKQFVCPAVMDYFNRHYWMNDNVYTDAPTLSSQLYVFTQVAFYKFTIYQGETTEGDTYGLEPTPAPWNNASSILPTNNVTVDQLYQYGLDLINSLAEWDSVFTISGYLMKAFEGAAMFVVDEEPLISDFTPIYSEEVLSQIENAQGICFQSVGDTINYTGMKIQQSTSAPVLVASNAVTLTQSNSSASTLPIPMQMSSPGPVWINLHVHGQPSPENVVIASRLKTIYATSYTESSIYPSAFTGSTAKSITVTALSGSEVVLGISLVKRLVTQKSIVQNLLNPYPLMGRTWDTVQIGLAEFDWHPILHCYQFAASSGTHPALWEYFPYGDAMNLSTMTTEQFKEINRMCLYSEFNAFGF